MPSFIRADAAMGRLSGPTAVAPSAAPAPAAPVTLAAAESAEQQPAMPNPRLRLDGILGMVVIEFRNSAGDVAVSIPTPRELRAYRAAALTNAPLPIGTPPAVGSGPVPPAKAIRTA